MLRLENENRCTLPLISIVNLVICMQDFPFNFLAVVCYKITPNLIYGIKIYFKSFVLFVSCQIFRILKKIIFRF